MIRQPRAYPAYDAEHRETLAAPEAWLSTLESSQAVGGSGLHRCNNQDHSMLAAMLAACNVMGQDHDVWDTNVERSYYEVREPA